MRQINLLPPEIFRRRQARRRTTMLAGGVIGIAVILLGIFLLQAGRVSSARSKLEAQERKNAGLQAEAARLARFAQLQSELAAKKGVLASLTQSEVRWSVILADLATIVPQDVWLTSFSGVVQPAAAGARTTTAGGVPTMTTFGTISMTGCTLLPPEGTHLAVAAWLIRLGVPREFVNAYITLSAKGSGDCPVSFNATVNLADQALRRNQRGGERAQ